MTTTYSRRAAPSDPTQLKGFLDQELQNVQRGIATAFTGSNHLHPSGSDDTTRIQSAIQPNSTTFLEDGDFIISTDLIAASNHQLVLAGPATTITQITPGKGVYKRIGCDNSWFHYNGGQIYGPGVWSASWSGIDGHGERGEQIYGCTNSGSTLAKIYNFGLAGMVVLGGTALRFLSPFVEGTNLRGSPLSPGDDYQFGYLMGHDLVYGAFSDVQFWGMSASQTNFGFNSYMNIPGSKGLLLLAGAHMYNIIGQHGGYCGTSNTQLPFYCAHDCGLDGLKIFSGAIAEQISGTEVSNFTIWNCVGQAVEYGVSGAGHIERCRVSGKVDNCGRAITYDGDVRYSDCDIEASNITQFALYVANSLNPQGPRGCRWAINADSVAQHGVEINSSTSADNTLVARIRHAGTGSSAVGVLANACASLTIDNLYCFDDAGTMQTGLLNAAGANSVKLTGTATLKGYTANGIRADGRVNMHATVDADSAVTAFYDTGENIFPVAPLVIQKRTASAANVNVWKYTLDDLSSYTVEATISAKNSGSVDQAMFKSTVMAMRNGGGAVIPAVANNPDEDVNAKSAGFIGAYSWAVSGNALLLQANSGAAANVDWTATIRMTRQL